jgi:hypothetical protein
MRPALWIAFPIFYFAVAVGLIGAAIPAWALIDPAAAMPEHAILYAATLLAIIVGLEGAARVTRPFKTWMRAKRVQSVLTATALGLGAALADAGVSAVVMTAFAINYPASSFKAIAVGLMTGAVALEWLRYKTRRAAAKPAAAGLSWTMADLIRLYQALSRGDRDMLDGALARRSSEMITVEGSRNHRLWTLMAELGWLEAATVPPTLQEGALAGRFRAFAITGLGIQRLPEFIAAAQVGEFPAERKTQRASAPARSFRLRPLL